MFAWEESDNSRVTSFDALRLFLHDLTSSLVDKLNDLIKFTGNVRGVAVENWRVSVLDLSWVLHDDDLSSEVITSLSWVLFGIRANRSSGDILNSKTLDVESDVVSWVGSLELSVVLLNGLDFSLDSRWSELGQDSWLEDTGLDSSDWNSSDTRNLVDVLEWESQWPIRWSNWSR